MQFDMKKARAICEHVCHPFAEVCDEDVGEAMEQFSRALSRVEELETALIEERSRALWISGDDPEHPANLEWETAIPKRVRVQWECPAKKQLQLEGRL